MNTKKLTYLLALGLAFTFAFTGCKTKGPLKPLSATQSESSTSAASNLPANRPLISDPNAEGSKGLPDWKPEDYDQDRSALATETVHFDYDSAVVKNSEIPHVEAVAARMRSDGSAKLLVMGHCDERGTEEYNRSLGERRALALRDELSRLSIDAARVQTRSFGEDQPADNGHDESAWSKNRRGEFVLLHPKK